MTAALTPENALAYLRELSTDVRDAIVLDGQGQRLAGSEALGDPARELMGRSDAEGIEIKTVRGSVFAVRSSTHAIVVAAGRFALASVMFYDLRTVLEDLEGDRP